MVNLISNAVKFTEKGSITVRTDVLKLTEERARIRLAVEDTGIGIAHEKQSTIFERFHQAEAETTRRFGGTGLGLSIVKQLVELQKGNLRLESEPGRGSAFIVELEFKLPDLAQLYSAALASQEEQVPLQKIKVLIAEDNPMNQQLVAHLMKSWAIDFQIVDNGEKVIEAVKKGNYSIILMDIQMPEMDGYTATSIIRNEMQLDIPIIAMTAHAMVGEKEKCLQLGMNDYVSKPIKETVLYNMIAHHAQHIPESEVHDAQTVSLDYLHQLSGNDAAFEKEILQQFLIQTPVELNQLKTHIEQKEFSLSRRAAHSLKSTVGYVGLAEELHPYLERIEKNSAAEEDDNLITDFEHVNQVCEQALREVKSMLDKGLV